MRNLKRAGKKPLIISIIALSLLISAPLSAQTIIALHPFMGQEEADRVSSQFFLRMIQEIRAADGGNYSPYIINLDLAPPDVPEGGFPPWICPSPSITGNSSHAITGEAVIDPDDPDLFRIRVYLWQMAGARLLGSDEMNVGGPEDLENMNLFMQVILSWINPEDYREYIILPPLPVSVTGPTLQHNWLYVGIRGGGGYSRWTYDYGTENPIDSNVTAFLGGNISLQAAVGIFPFFRIQGEANLFADIAPVRNQLTGVPDGNYFALALKTPLLLKFVWHGEQIRTGIFAGAYAHWPLMQRGSETALGFFKYRADIPGFVGGMNIGWRLGPGTLFADLRIDYDGRWYHRNDRGELHYTNSVRLNVGYEMGFFPKPPRN